MGVRPYFERRYGAHQNGGLRFAEILPPLAVRDDDVRHANRAQHVSGDFAGHRAFLAPVKVLRADPNIRAVRPFHRGGQIGNGGQITISHCRAAATSG